MKPQPTDTVPPWVAYSGVAVVGGVSLVVLAWYQHILGVHAGMPEALSWSLSIGLDWGSAVAGVFWFFGVSTLKTWGRWTAVGLLAGSTAGSCVAWGLTSGWVWAPLGVVHPAVFFLMAKLLTLWQAQRSETVHMQDARSSGKSTGSNAGPKKSVADAKPKPSARFELPAQPIEWARMRLANGDPAGWRSIKRNHPDLTEHAAKQAATEAKAHTTNGTSLHAVGGRS